VSASQFPYHHSGEPYLPGYHRVRAEGLPLGQAIRSGVGYLRKYRNPKTSAPLEEIAHFDEQRRLLRALKRQPALSDGLRLAMVGDLMWLGFGWDSFLSPGVLKFLNAHEVVLGNLESVISRRHRVPSWFPDYFTYNSNPCLVTSFRRPSGGSSFSALATCNNHSLDRGDQGLRDTLDFLDEQRIPHAGVRSKRDEKPYITWQTGGITFGFYAACWGFNNPALGQATGLQIEVVPGLVPKVQHPVDVSRVQRALADMTADGVDFKIVYMHWGYEFEFYPCPDIMQVGREIVRAGADIVMGSHPHVVQPLEVFCINGYEARADMDPELLARAGSYLEDGTGVPRKALIAYSLGNFATAMFTLHCQTGMVLSLGLRRDPASGRVDWHHPRPTLVFTARNHPGTPGRRLMLLDEYLRDQQAGGRPHPSLCTLAAYIYRHLGWGENGPISP
jgi:hypothetical protein